MEIILIYAGIVKINFDWLQLYPLKYWFAAQGGVFNEIWVIGIAAYGAIFYMFLELGCSCLKKPESGFSWFTQHFIAPTLMFLEVILEFSLGLLWRLQLFFFNRIGRYKLFIFLRISA
jgi:hypothetical protein